MAVPQQQMPGKVGLVNLVDDDTTADEIDQTGKETTVVTYGSTTRVTTLSPAFIAKQRQVSPGNNYKERPNPGSEWRQYKTYLQCPLGKKWYYRYKSDNNNDLNEDAEVPTNQEHVATDKIKKVTYSLCYYHDEDERKGKLIIQYTPVANMRIFTMFPSFLDFARYANRVEPNLRCFYESVSGDMAQKPHFDLDIKQQDLIDLGIDDHHIIISYLVDAIFIVLARHDIYLEINRDLLIYSSHGTVASPAADEDNAAADEDNAAADEDTTSSHEETFTKVSYHVIINHYYHSNNKEAGYFANLVIAEMPEELQPFVDKSVYSSFQQFRILGSQKVGSGRPKVFNETYLLPAIDEDGDDILIEHEYDGIAPDDYVQKNIQLAESLITQVIGCYLLPSFIPFEGREQRVYTDVDDLTKEAALTALKYIATVADITIRDARFPYRISRIQGNRIDLQRIRTSYCRQCKRAHQNQNPYMVVSPTNKLFFYCRRKKDASGRDVGYLVGIIPGDFLVKLDDEGEAAREQSIRAKMAVTSMLQRYVGSIIHAEDASVAGTSTVQQRIPSYMHVPSTPHLLNAPCNQLNNLQSPSTVVKSKEIDHQQLRLLASQPIPGKKPLKDRRKTDKKRKQVVFANIFDTLDW